MEPLIIRKEYVEEFIIERDDEGKLIEPKCDGCSSGVDRQKCMWERGDCPRHEMQDVYRKALRGDPTNHNFHKYGYAPEECAYCHQPESAHEAKK